MGFFDKVKAIKNTITGGAAKVYVACDPIAFGEPFEVVITANVKDADLKIDRVYLEVEGCESICVRDTDIEYDEDGDLEVDAENVYRNVTTFESEITVEGARQLDANESFEWTVSVELPEDALPIYRGPNCTHTYQVRAGLDCFGNDPDSGWVELELP